MRFLSRVLRASASAGVNSTLRSSTPPFFPLLALPSASAFSVRLAESRAAISPALGLPGAAATPALPGAAATLAGILATGLAAFGTGLAATLVGTFAGALPATLRLPDFDRSRDCALTLPFAAVRGATLGVDRFLPCTELREAGFAGLRFFAARLPRVVRAADAERRAGRLAERLAVGRALPRLRTADFLVGLEGFLAIFILLGWAPHEEPRSDAP